MQGSGGLSDVNLLANGDFEEDGGWIFNSPAFIDESGEHAWSGHKCVCFGSPPANQVISIRQNGLPLEPGKQYTVRYRQKSTGSASTQTINPYPQVMYQVGTSYRAVRGDARRVYDEYTLTEWVFTLPEEARDSPSLDFFIIMPTSSWARNGMGHIDAVTLCEGAPEQSNVGKHGWLTMRDIPAYETPGGGKVRHRLDTSARILICDQTTIDGITWYQAGDFFYRLGWIRADCTS